jgi:BirA family biotin operon repressor/biotin-[acetyl-CoA-carboxylase] ligase
MGEFELAPRFRLIRHARLDSTNEEAKRLAQADAPGGSLVWAVEQTSGRGRHGRTWASPPGNLYASLLLRPACPVAEAPQLGFVAAVAAAESTRAVLPGRDGSVRCKWPNDVLVDGRKVAGILIESATGANGGLAWVVLGFGVNLRSHPVGPDMNFPASSLVAEGADGVEAATFLEDLGGRLDRWLDTWSRQGFAPVRDAWLRLAYRLHGPIRVRLGQEVVMGTFSGIDPGGALIVEGEGTRRVISAGEVFPVTSANAAVGG